MRSAELRAQRHQRPSKPASAADAVAARGNVLRGCATYSRAYEGPIGNVHGGFAAAAFDDLMAWPRWPPVSPATRARWRSRC
jgi:hypothetical protein